jgi:alpha-L-arabinofuranosidase B-like protein/concanavalin A-like lectin/glucanase superfamily protein/lamin tail-like protein
VNQVKAPSPRGSLLCAALLVVAVAAGLAGTTFATGTAAQAASPAPPPRPQGPCDIYAAGGTPCVAAHSTTRALYASYDGPLYQVRRASDNAVKDIGVVESVGGSFPAAGGYADAAAQDAFCANTVCWITILYDQSPMHNDLTQAPRGGFSGPALGGFNNLPIADMAPITISGHKAYGVFIEPGMGLRDDDPVGTAVDDQPEGQYWVINGQHFNSGCCFDYGNAEIDSRDDGNGTMETTYFGNATAWYHGPAPGPWIMTDQENNLVGCVNPGSTSKLCAGLPSITWRFATGTAKGEPHHWASLGGDSQQGSLSTMFDGPRVDSTYDPMRKQGAIVLGNGGDNSNGSQGTFYEGVMTSGYPTDATDQLVQANIVAAEYDVQRLTVSPASNPATPTISRVAGKFGNAVKLNGTSTNLAVQLPNGIVSSLHDFTISAWVNPQETPTWSRIFDFGSGTDVYMFLATSAGSTPRFAITINGNAAGAEQVINAPTALPLNEWTNIAVTLTGTTGRMYVDGVQVAENTNMTLSPSSMGSTTQNWIGKSQYDDPLLNAIVDDFQIYDRALSAAELTALQTAPGAGNVADYRFDEDSGETVLDSSGNGRTGTILTASASTGSPGLQTFAPGSSQDTTVTFTNTTGSRATGVKLSISPPNKQWTSVVPGTTDTSVTFDSVAPDARVSATFRVTSGPATFNGDLIGNASWTNPTHGRRQSETTAERVRNVRPIKINEFRTGTSTNASDAFIELYNAGAGEVDISNWTLTEHPAQQAIFSTVAVPAGTTLAAGGHYLLGLSNSGLAAPAGAGDATINVRSTTGMAAGDQIDIDTGSRMETRTVASVGTAATANTTLWQPLPEGPVMTIPAGSTNVPVTSTSGFTVGQRIGLGYGADYEIATATVVGRTGTQGRLSAAAPAGATNIKVTSTTNISVGDTIRLDIASTGHGIETVTVAAVGTSGAGGTGLTLTAPLQFSHSSNLPFSDRGTGISFTPATAFAHSSNEPVQALGTGITLDKPLDNRHAISTPVRDAVVTTAGYQGPPAPNQWFGGPALSSGAGNLVLRDVQGLVVDSLNYGTLVDPWAAEGYQGTSGTGQSGCRVTAPGSAAGAGRSAVRIPDGHDTDSNCTDFVRSNNPTPGGANLP